MRYRFLTRTAISFLIVFSLTASFTKEGISKSATDKVYNSVVLIAHEKWSALGVTIDVLSIASMVFGGPGVFVGPETHKGTGFLTTYGVITNGHVVKNTKNLSLLNFKGIEFDVSNETIEYSPGGYKFPSELPAPKSSVAADVEGDVTGEYKYYLDKPDKNDPKYLTFEDIKIKVAKWGDGDKGTDLALIPVSLPNMDTLQLGWEVNVGDEVFAVGHPEKKKFVPAMGKIVAIYSTDIEINFYKWYVGKGSSGSPVLNKDGYVIGVIKGQNINNGNTVAIHINEVRKCLGLPCPILQRVSQLPVESKNITEGRPGLPVIKGARIGDIFWPDLYNQLGLLPDDVLIQIIQPPHWYDIVDVASYKDAKGKFDKNKPLMFRVSREGHIYTVRLQYEPYIVYETAKLGDKISPVEKKVFIYSQSKIFHKVSCPELSGKQNINGFSDKESLIKSGFYPCPICKP